MNFIFFHEICIFMYSRNGRDRIYFYDNWSKDDLFYREREREREHVVSLRTYIYEFYFFPRNMYIYVFTKWKR